ncbi:hypothetical protein C8R46DRAFT_1025873 [Mycena filopes]|nr:hypothetical protein C8R46DRAFT_1025873 [Mycena filopes]
MGTLRVRKSAVPVSKRFTTNGYAYLYTHAKGVPVKFPMESHKIQLSEIPSSDIPMADIAGRIMKLPYFAVESTFSGPTTVPVMIHDCAVEAGIHRFLISAYYSPEEPINMALRNLLGHDWRGELTIVALGKQVPYLSKISSQDPNVAQAINKFICCFLERMYHSPALKMHQSIMSGSVGQFATPVAPGPVQWVPDLYHGASKLFCDRKVPGQVSELTAVDGLTDVVFCDLVKNDRWSQRVVYARGVADAFHALYPLAPKPKPSSAQHRFEENNVPISSVTIALSHFYLQLPRTLTRPTYPRTHAHVIPTLSVFTPQHNGRIRPHVNGADPRSPRPANEEITNLQRTPSALPESSSQVVFPRRPRCTLAPRDWGSPAQGPSQPKADVMANARLSTNLKTFLIFKLHSQQQSNKITWPTNLRFEDATPLAGRGTPGTYGSGESGFGTVGDIPAASLLAPRIWVSATTPPVPLPW